MSDNNKILNEIPNESDTMDISEISDQATPLSSPSEVIDSQKPNANYLDLDNAVTTARTLSTSLTTAKLLGTITMTTSTTSTLSTSISNVMSNTTNITGDTNNTTGTTHSTDKDCLFGKVQDPIFRDPCKWSNAGEDADLSREHSESKLSLEGFDLELPTLEMYQEEFVDFPSSPTHENFQPHMLGGDHDSGNAGGSEEEDEDTSIYKAVLSPNCQDVRLRKGETSVVTPTSTPAINPVKSAVISTGNLMKTPTAGTLRKILSPDPEDAELPDIGGIRVVVEDGTCDLNSKSVPLQKCRDSSFGITPTLSVPLIASGSHEDNSNFVFERRNSKRLTQHELGERVMEGLFVESRHKYSGGNAGQRKISVPHEVLCSSESGAKDLHQTFGNCNTYIDLSKKPQSVAGQYLTSTDSDSGLGRSVPGSSLKLPPLYSSEFSNVTIPPCPKPRRRNITSVVIDSSNKFSELLLNPLALCPQSSLRGVASVNPNGTVESQERPGSLISSQCGGRRRIRVTADILGGHSKEDDEEEDCNGSSIGGRSSRLSDADLLSPGEDEPDLNALSPGLDTPDQLEDSIMEPYEDLFYQSPFVGLGEPPPLTLPSAAVRIPELTAVEERVESRSWRSCIVQGVERRIDMKVIEPYKRVLSHGGYLTAGSHNAIIVFSACFLPDRSRLDYDYVMDNLFLYVLTTLDQLITEDYVLIYLHGATQRSCMPTFTWLKRCYQLIDRRLRKNLKGLYLVHPTFWLKTIVLMTKPFISSKFSRKLRFVDTLSELATVVPLEQASIPDRVKQLDDDLEESGVKRRSLLSWWWPQTPHTTTVSS